MASSQQTPSYTRPQPVFDTVDELFEAIEDLIEKGLVQAFLDNNNEVRIRPLGKTEGVLDLVEHGCGTLTEVA